MSGSLEIRAAPLAGLLEIRRTAKPDPRGWFERMYCVDELRAAGVADVTIAQINRSSTRLRGTIRGMHFQLPPHGETKIVSCLRGEVFDVAVDVREGSPTFLAWYGTVLSADNRASLLLPKGFAHGFQALSDDCELLYFHDAAHAPQAEAGIHPLDTRVGIRWPLPVGSMSDRDAAREPLSGDFQGVQPR